MTNSSKEFSDALKYWEPLTAAELIASYEYGRREGLVPANQSFPEWLIFVRTCVGTGLETFRQILLTQETRESYDSRVT